MFQELLYALGWVSAHFVLMTVFSFSYIKEPKVNNLDELTKTQYVLSGIRYLEK